MNTEEVKNWSLRHGFSRIGYPGYVSLNIEAWSNFQLNGANWCVDEESGTVWSSVDQEAFTSADLRMVLS